MYSYTGLERILRAKAMKKSDLTKKLHISSRTIAKIAKGEKLSDRVLQKLCRYFSCAVGELFCHIPDNPILAHLREEKAHKIPGGLYHELQIRLTYNSNHMEGSQLSEDQTRRIFETNTIDAGDSLPVDDIIETVNHFRAIDYCLDVAEEPLTETIIKTFHALLKSRTKDETLSWFRVGDYKLRPNTVGGKETAAPEEVAEKIRQLLAIYHQKTTQTFENIVSFHWQFECIHPFQDGNGRVGRLIALKECLKNNLLPFLLEDGKKHYYYRGLKEYERDPLYLLDTCRDGQDTFRCLLERFAIPAPKETKNTPMPHSL